MSSSWANKLTRLLDAVRWPRSVESQVPLGRALVDHARSGRPRTLRVDRTGGVRYELGTDEFFELGGEQAPIDAALVAACRGRVLDVGAGAGRHVLALEQAGSEAVSAVVAIDVSADCVALMRDRGVRDARETDVWQLVESAPDVTVGEFDTVLFGMQSIGITGTLEGLERLLHGLARSPGLLAPGGQVLLDSSAPTGPGFVRRIDCADAAALAEPASDETLAGETAVAFSYRNLRGRPFEWLYIGGGALRSVAAQCGFDCETLTRLEGSPEYVARLIRHQGASTSHAGPETRGSEYVARRACHAGATE